MSDDVREHGPWKILQSHEVYRDPWLRVQRDDVVRPDGDLGSYVVAHLKPGVSVIALDHERNVYLTSEFHYGVGRVTVESVSGGIDPGEEPIEAARRELAEELGITAASWMALGSTDPFTANVVSPTALFLAQDLSFGGAKPEGTEQIDRVVLSLAEAVQMALRGDISHAPSALAVLKTFAVIEGRFKGV